MRYTHIFFDIDNTLLDFDETERLSLMQFFADVGVEYNEQNVSMYKRVNGLWWKKLELGEVTIPQLSLGRTSGFFKEAGLELDPVVYADRLIGYLASHCILLDGALGLLQKLAPCCTMYLITNGIARVQHGRIDGSPISGYFSGLFISEEIGFSKPSREFFNGVFSRIDSFPAEKALIVGDSLTSDIPGGAVCGIDTCWYNPAGVSCGNVRPTYTARTHEQIAEIILNNS